jgi:hypothetical protein
MRAVIIPDISRNFLDHSMYYIDNFPAGTRCARVPEMIVDAACRSIAVTGLSEDIHREETLE